MALAAPVTASTLLYSEDVQGLVQAAELRGSELMYGPGEYPIVPIGSVSDYTFEDLGWGPAIAPGDRLTGTISITRTEEDLPGEGRLSCVFDQIGDFCRNSRVYVDTSGGGIAASSLESGGGLTFTGGALIYVTDQDISGWTPDGYYYEGAYPYIRIDLSPLDDIHAVPLPPSLALSLAAITALLVGGRARRTGSGRFAIRLFRRPVRPQPEARPACPA